MKIETAGFQDALRQAGSFLRSRAKVGAPAYRRRSLMADSVRAVSGTIKASAIANRDREIA
jgi:hypothetical protein